MHTFVSVIKDKSNFLPFYRIFCFVFFSLATLGLIREVYYNNKIKMIDSCDELKSNPKYPKHPDSYDIINAFDAPQNIAEYFGQRIRGWFLAPLTGNYTFRTSCNQVCELYLSNDTDPQNKVLIIKQTDRSEHNNFSK